MSRSSSSLTICAATKSPSYELSPFVERITSILPSALLSSSCKRATSVSFNLKDCMSCKLSSPNRATSSLIAGQSFVQAGLWTRSRSCFTSQSTERLLTDRPWTPSPLISLDEISLRRAQWRVFRSASFCWISIYFESSSISVPTRTCAIFPMKPCMCECSSRKLKVIRLNSIDYEDFNLDTLFETSNAQCLFFPQQIFIIWHGNFRRLQSFHPPIIALGISKTNEFSLHPVSPPCPPHIYRRQRSHQQSD